MPTCLHLLIPLVRGTTICDQLSYYNLLDIKEINNEDLKADTPLMIPITQITEKIISIRVRISCIYEIFQIIDFPFLIGATCEINKGKETLNTLQIELEKRYYSNPKSYETVPPCCSLLLRGGEESPEVNSLII